MHFFSPFWFWRLRIRSKEYYECKEEINRAKIKAENLPKEYNYYCPFCLFQTNEKYKTCPKCAKSKLHECK